MHVVHIFAVEAVTVPKQAGRFGKDLGVSGPAQTLVPLGAVGGQVQEVPLLAPAYVFKKAVDQRMACGQISRLLQIAVQDQGREIFFLEICDPFDLYIAAAEEGKAGHQKGLLTAADIPVFGQGGPVVVVVKAALLKDFPKLQADPFPCLFPKAQGKDACQVLAKVQDLFSCGGMQEGNGLYPLLHSDRQRIAVRKRGFSLSDKTGLRLRFPKGIVPVLPVVDA